MGVEFGVRFVSSGKVAVLVSRERAEGYVRVWSRLGFPAELVSRLRPTAGWKPVCLCGLDSTHDAVLACKAAPCMGLVAVAAREAQLVGGGSR